MCTRRLKSWTITHQSMARNSRVAPAKRTAVPTLTGNSRLHTLFITLVVLCLGSTVASVAQEERYPVRACGNQTTAWCRADECRCQEWWVDYYDRNGKVWGADSAKTLSALQKKIESSQRFDHSWARFTGGSVENDKFNHQRPGKPTCRTECSYQQSSLAESRRKIQRNRIEQEADGILDKITAEWGRVTVALGMAERKQGNPYRGVGIVLNDYANALRDVLKKQKELRETLQRWIATNSDLTFYQLTSLSEDLRRSNDKIRNMYDGLPTNARRLLTGRELELSSDGWATQRILGFDGQPVLQSIQINNDSVTVSYKSNTGIGKTYSFKLTDLTTTGVAVELSQSGRWAVLLSTQGRRITQIDQGLMGGGGLEVRSRVTLYFNTEADARAAAQAFGALP